MNTIQKRELSWLPYILIVILLHIIGFNFLFIADTNHLLFSMEILSCTLGLHHVFDTNHIAAIDNTVCKLLQQ
ncbi:high-affinity nickel permease [Staphylococcus hominis]